MMKMKTQKKMKKINREGRSGPPGFSRLCLLLAVSPCLACIVLPPLVWELRDAVRRDHDPAQTVPARATVGSGGARERAQTCRIITSQIR